MRLGAPPIDASGVPSAPIALVRPSTKGLAMSAAVPDPGRTPASMPPRGNLSKRARGQWGEDLAARHYRRLGYRVLDRNWRSPSGELDLVVERDGIIVFSEVKARRSDRYGPAAAAVGPAKQRRIRQLAVEWLGAHDCARTGIRFDVVAITGVRVELIESAF